MSLGLGLCVPQAWGNAQAASFSKEAYRYEPCCHLILQGLRYFLWCPESVWLFPTPYFLKMSVWGIFSWKFRTPTSSLWWLPHHFCLQNEAPSMTQFLFFFNLENPPPPLLHKLSAWMISSQRAIPIFFSSSLQGGLIFSGMLPFFPK